MTVVAAVAALVVGLGEFFAEPSAGHMVTSEAFGDKVTHSSTPVAGADPRSLRP